VLHGIPYPRVQISPHTPTFTARQDTSAMGCSASKPAVQESAPMPMGPVTPAVRPPPPPPQTVPELPAQVSRAPSHRSRRGSTTSTHSTKSQHGTPRHRVGSAPQREPSLSSQDPRSRSKTLGVPSGSSRASRPGPRLSTPGKSNAQ
jgi:hypothetical protein